MNSASSRSAAGQRRSAVAERIIIQEEWSALKGTNKENEQGRKFLMKKPHNVLSNKNNDPKKHITRNKDNFSGSQVSEVLRGVVVLVDVGSESRALALRAALAALGATVVPAWSTLVTHLVWSQGGCTKTRAKARSLACHLVSPLWVESCAASARRLPENMFPALTRPSDLPSPATCRKMLKKIDQENIPLNILSDEQRPRLKISSESNRTDTSNDKSLDSSRDKSLDTSQDTSCEKRKRDENNVNTAPRGAVPASPKAKKSRRQLFVQKESDLESTRKHIEEETPTPRPPTKKVTQEVKKQLAQAERVARRLLGTPKKNKPAVDNDGPKVVLTNMTKEEREKIIEAIGKLNGTVQNRVTKTTTHVVLGSYQPIPNIQTDSQTIQNTNVIQCQRTPNGQMHVRTSTQRNVIMCQKCNSPERILTEMLKNNVIVTDKAVDRQDFICQCNISGINVLNQQGNMPNDKENLIDKRNRIDINNLYGNSQNSNRTTQCSQGTDIDIRQGNGVEIISTDIRDNIQKDNQGNDLEVSMDNQDVIQNGQTDTQNPTRVRVNFPQRFDEIENLIPENVFEDFDFRKDKKVRSHRKDKIKDKPRTIKALLGAIRGCRIVSPEWVLESLRSNKWVHHAQYEVPHLKKISQNAHLERLILNKMNSAYAYNVFNGMRVKVSDNAELRDDVRRLLTLCGAVTQDGEQIQNGGLTQTQAVKRSQKWRSQKRQKALTQSTVVAPPEPEVTVGVAAGEVCSRWVFDSIAATRPRTARPYVNT